MSKKMTPCEELGYKVGDGFSVLKKGGWFNVGELVYLGRDDNSGNPYFFNERMPKDHEGGYPLHIDSVEKVCEAKLKPAKQALADAIHQNGGWSVFDESLYATMEKSASVSFYANKPYRSDEFWFGTLSDESFKAGCIIQNWHQTILSRDEYFTAYPEQVKVEANNETERKVEAEMKSESEVAIKAGDWHKNGDLPPVGEVCEIHHKHWSNDKFHKVKVLAITYEHLVVRYETFEQHYLLKYISFRPLRTERDREIEEMAKVVGLNVSVFEVEAGKLYDAGYRKEVK